MWGRKQELTLSSAQAQGSPEQQWMLSPPSPPSRKDPAHLKQQPHQPTRVMQQPD